MKIPEDEERPLAWTAIPESTPVHSSDDAVVGTVAAVVGAEDIFHGIAVRSGWMGDIILVPGDAVERITNWRIDLRLSAEEFRGLPPHAPAE